MCYLKITTIIGARPQFIKAATVSRAIAKHNATIGEQPSTINHQLSIIKEIIIHTGQHFDANMSEVFFQELDIPTPDYNLGIGGGSHGSNTGRMIEAIEAVLVKEQPDWVLVYGDTDSTLAGALAAVKLHIPITHVEAGLRSFNTKMPEEINRILTDRISTLLFCPTETAVKNLINEGFDLNNNDERSTINNQRPVNHQLVLNVGDVMYDAALFYADKAKDKSCMLDTLGLSPENYVLATIHRAENTDAPNRLQNIMAALNQIAADMTVVLPLHPRTRQILNLSDFPGITFIDPLGYLDMVMLEKNARVIITDSGGVQKEAYFHSVPCVTVRVETEWVELVEIGANILAGSGCQQIVDAYNVMKNKVIDTDNLYGAGDASDKIVKTLIELNGVGSG